MNQHSAQSPQTPLANARAPSSGSRGLPSWGNQILARFGWFRDVLQSSRATMQEVEGGIQHLLRVLPRSRTPHAPNSKPKSLFALVATRPRGFESTWAFLESKALGNRSWPPTSFCLCTSRQGFLCLILKMDTSQEEFQ